MGVSYVVKLVLLPAIVALNYYWLSLWTPEHHG